MNTEVRALPYPVLEAGNLSCPQGVYDTPVQILSDHASARISHHLSGFPFLQNIIDDHRAKYACSVSIPITGYRRLHLSEGPEQTVVWEKEFCGDPPMLRPMIITEREIRHTFQTGDGVAGIWQGRELVIPRGARLALGTYWGETATMENLIELLPYEDLPAGSFEVRPHAEQGFYFKVRTAPDLYHFLQDSRGHAKHQRSIITHIASRCLEVLANEFGEQAESDEEGVGWNMHQNLRALAGLLEKKDQLLWDDESFAPDKVATQLYPHLLPLAGDEEGEEYE